MMDLRSGLPYHWIRNGLPHTYSTLERDARCDVLIVGGGITGALCANTIAATGMSTMLVEARSIATASTSASTALLQYEIDTPLHTLVDHVGEKAAARSYVLCAQAVTELLELANGVGKGLARARKSFQFATKRAHAEALRKEQAVRKEHGLSVELLDASDIHARFGFRKAAGLLSNLGAEMDPYAFTHALLQHLMAKGTQVYDRTTVQRFEQREGEFRVRTNTGHTIRSQHLVMATGYESQRYLPAPLVDLNSTYALASQRIEQNEFWYEDCLIWETATPYLYLRTTPDRRVILGGLDEPFRNPERRDALLDGKTRRLARAFKKLFPKIPLEPEYSWCGTFGSTKDGLPYIDRDPTTGAWFVLGMGGNGITFSQVGAHIVANAILGKHDSDRDLFRFDR